MRKGIRGMMGVMLSASLIMSPVMEAMAANQFHVEAEDVTGKVLFPGDSISGISPIYLGPDGVSQELQDGTWTNNTSQAYTMSGVESEEGGLWLEPEGYVLTVKGGKSKAAGTDGSDTSNHYKAKDEWEDAEISKDVAYYDAWSEVTVTADAPQEGQIFDHWEIESTNVTLADERAAETTFTMVDASVVLKAVYTEAPAEEPMTEAPVTEAPIEEPVTEAPVAAPETEITEAPLEIPTNGGLELDPEQENSGDGYTEAPVSEDGILTIGEDNGTGSSEENGSGEVITELYTLTVENGSGSGEYAVGDVVTVTADTIEGMTFAGWTTNADTVWFADSTMSETTFSMPAESVVVSASYNPVVIETEPVSESEENNGAEQDPNNGESPVMTELYTVEVEHGQGGGTYEAGSVVYVEADAAAEGEIFAGWTASENVLLENPAGAETSFVMPSGEVKLTANYKTAETTAETPVTETEVVAVPEDANGAEMTETEAETLPGLDAQAGETEIEPVIETETETEAETEQAVAQSFVIELSSHDDVAVAGAIVDANGQIVANAGDTITITATEYDDLVLSGWVIARVDTKENITPTINQANPSMATFIMPNSVVYVEPVYEQLNDNDVQVINGSGSGTYQEGEYVEIIADDPQEGYRFKGWTVISGDIALDDETADVTGFIMPNSAVQVKAVYEVVKYTLTVNNGSGGGSYTKGETINLTANYPASGKVFAGWKVTSENASVAASDRYYSSITMPAANVTVEATYKDGPSPDYNEIQGIVSGGEYLKGTQLSFTAVGNGMSNTNPNPGDYRYRPSGYQIGSVTGSWSNAPYTITMRIDAAREYTLTVTYVKDVFDGNSWVSDGTTASKSVNFYVVNALSVQTGDNSPIIPLVAAAAVALIVIILLVVFRRRRR